MCQFVYILPAVNGIQATLVFLITRISMISFRSYWPVS